MWGLIIAGAIAVVGGIVGAVSGSQQSKKQRAEIERQKAAEQKRRAEQVAIMDAEFADAQKTAGIHADRGDRTTDINENLLSLAYNNSINQIGGAMEQVNRQNQMTSIGNDSSISGAFAAMGASGVRSSSSSYDAVDRYDALYDENLALNVRSQEDQRESAMLSAYASLEGNRQSLQQNRYGAQDLRDLYGYGGSAYESFQRNRQFMLNEGERVDANYQAAYDAADYTFLDGVTDFFGGAQTGYSLASSAASYTSDWGSIFSKPAGSAPLWDYRDSGLNKYGRGR